MQPRIQDLWHFNTLEHPLQCSVLMLCGIISLFKIPDSSFSCSPFWKSRILSSLACSCLVEYTVHLIFSSLSLLFSLYDDTTFALTSGSSSGVKFMWYHAFKLIVMQAGHICTCWAGVIYRHAGEEKANIKLEEVLGNWNIYRFLPKSGLKSTFVLSSAARCFW